ncbi:MAG: hypothetical protein ABIO65_11795 [Nitrospiria bacterium]
MKRIETGVLAGMLWLATMGVGMAAPASGAVETAAVSAVEDEGAVVRSRQLSGTVVGIDRLAKTVTVKARTGEKTFILSPRVQIKLGKQKAILSDVQPGKRVFIRYRDVDGQAMATTVKML